MNVFDEEKAQRDLTLTLLSAEQLENLPVIYYRERQDDEETFFRTAMEKGRNSRKGAVAATLTPESVANRPNVSGPILDWDFPIVICTQHDINMAGQTGTLRNSSAWGQWVMDVLHQERDEKWGMFIVTGKALATDEPRFVFPGCAGWKVTLRMTVGACVQTPKCAPPQYTIAGGEMSFTCATGGATIRYTVDDTMPAAERAGSASANDYSGPIPVQSGDIIRAAAYAVGYNKSQSRYIVVP